ncbi:MAG: UDP-N-acetylmuramoyl-tripeptide-D-alanyl-D-alanine ligase [Candidatus Falkowbacteria bacterium GW2011_GWC2_38_22]|uniref:UDP-N-acetylmuramoyl-tripeptide-D-alanyl-D-alanine ligase n=1 Tax=Candidatus Falkowbacteria bacterium GW2011_GWE1_38_31 TaxID=1618638 RepID=A0A0G0JPX6_9BACT|nr:MAG: UDP-N-acetylmuramoyl-tripeptide-D-alanyl-D-alanine ligase [Candidatus Falkowbacteria bacterium GW2011_GWF2_38_1205]KKQ60545.1 MAG: UDP-N-acetylmuramoyl-tripeptide-D-alanyl-D-alanine ligase [Candidatus Falkowbacteria bacterium GW2011_GWC2_38_22]KKQ62664.1 MAG: UDP-N-acetylmuramoyl-tripeptide-D-alanyl-D-alanine ligase [Candidatus Falkowbacteria bacterium GW2011_GWF1_38_22]KKQ64724.1 MAG: UDP-N-acetylmuramoyl-tripeptide-D-alanyl-D-alanine ligase [Candidatus Falkowbacteria bacterium GW2011_G
MLKNIIQFKLKILAKIIVAKYKPRIIGITGSVGKTSTKEAVYTVLRDKFNTRSSIKNYNNEIGLPLTIIGTDSAGKSIIGWFKVFFKALKLILSYDNNYPRVIILEMGIDHPGDMEYLLGIAKPEIGILTFVGSVHAEFFGSKEKLRQEKSLLIKSVDKNGYSIINYDNEGSRKSISESKAKVISYGLDEKANLRAQEIRYFFEDMNDSALQGVNFKIIYNGAATPVLLPNVIGTNVIYAALASAAVGRAMDMNMVEISQALKKLVSPKGRMNIIKGIKNTIIIDDTYNAEPQSMIAAISILKKIPTKNKRIAVLGDMLELGKYSEAEHCEIGKNIFKLGIDRLVLVGEISVNIERGAIEAGMQKDQIFHFDKSIEAGVFLKNKITSGDLILVKGSQGMRMENVVKEIMLEPKRAPELLVRQDKEWENK